jgi:hypothetical protein
MPPICAEPSRSTNARAAEVFSNCRTIRWVPFALCGGKI